MIGVFDSGFGGLVILKELNKQFPEYDFLYLGDNARAPYGPRSAEEVFAFTLEAVEILFERGCEMVIIACNTASAMALRKIQQEVLPVKYPTKKVLGILVPTVEQVTGVNWIPEINTLASSPFNESLQPAKSVAVFATVGTVHSHAYLHEIKKRQPAIEVFETACPNLASLIEKGASREDLEKDINECIDRLQEQMGESYPPEAVLLGCTHYPIVHDLFVKALPDGVFVYDQAMITAESLKRYLSAHPELDARLTKKGTRSFLTTADPKMIEAMASKFYDKEIKYKTPT
jgi:glutamate racemase